MDPEALKNTPVYLVLAYAISWDFDANGGFAAVAMDDLPPSYALLDLRGYERPEALGEVRLREVMTRLLKEMYDLDVTDMKIKVIEDGAA